MHFEIVWQSFVRISIHFNMMVVYSTKFALYLRISRGQYTDTHQTKCAQKEPENFTFLVIFLIKVYPHEFFSNNRFVNLSRNSSTSPKTIAWWDAHDRTDKAHLSFSVLNCFWNLLNYFASSTWKQVKQVVISTGIFNFLHRYLFPYWYRYITHTCIAWKRRPIFPKLWQI